MKYLTNIAGGLLGVAFIAFSLMFFFKMMGDQPAPPPGSPVAMFMGAVGATGYMHFVKVCELVGGLLVAIPRTRNIGLLFLGPVILNIIAFHVFVAKDVTEKGTFVTLAVIGVLAAYLLWAGREKFAGLLNR
jgi:putative oxidoreductase